MAGVDRDLRHRAADRGTAGPVAGTNTEVARLPAGELQALLDNSTEYIARFDRTGRRLFLNRAAAALHGCSPQDLIGTVLTAELPPDAPAENADAISRLLAGIRQAADRDRRADLELSYGAEDGPHVMAFRLVPEHDASGAVVDVLVTGRDVTAQKGIERELELSRSRYHQLFDNARDQMILLEVTPDGRFRIMEANPSMLRAMRRSRSEVIGAFQDELYQAEPQVDQALVRAYRAAIAARQTVERELALDFSTGTRIYDAAFVPVVAQETGRVHRIVGIVRQITESRRAEQNLLRLNRTLKTLSDGNIALVRAADEPSLLRGMCQVMVRTGGYLRAWIGYLDPAADPTRYPAADPAWYPTRDPAADPGPGPAADPAQRRAPVVPVAWACARPREARRPQPDPDWVGPPEVLAAVITTGRPDLARPARSGSPWEQHPGQAERIGIASCLTLPLLHAGEPIGVFVVHSADPDAFQPDERRLLSELAVDLAYGIRNLRSRAEQERHEERLLQAMNATVQALADTTELRDPYTAGHQRRVAQLARAVGTQLGLSQDRVDGLFLASTIHDIGKISVPAEILSRPGRLSDLEFALVKQHVTAAYELLRPIEFPWPVADIVAQHHERCDGSGYPNGLQAHQLLLESRILAVCDVVEAMSSHRPYRPGLGLDAALAEIEDGRGTRYDAPAVDACIDLIRSGRFSFQ